MRGEGGQKINGKAIVYHQFRRNCISSTQRVVSHQAAGGCTLTRDDIQPQGADDIPPYGGCKERSDGIASLRASMPSLRLG